MIDYLKGKLVFKDPTYVIIEVNGIGYHVKISLGTFSKIKDEELVTLLTHLHIKEDAHTLYGFREDTEKKLFLQLISISGVGPNTALMILSSLNVEEIQASIVQEDHKTIQRVKGIGAKTAQRIVLELKDKIQKDNLISGATSQTGFLNQHHAIKDEAIQALITLGFTKAVAEKNITAILKKSSTEISLEELIKASLRST
ncbi:Holliday junction branch migration protein RuvA [Echinicola sediminis]